MTNKASDREELMKDLRTIWDKNTTSELVFERIADFILARENRSAIQTEKENIVLNERLVELRKKFDELKQYHKEILLASMLERDEVIKDLTARVETMKRKHEIAFSEVLPLMKELSDNCKASTAEDDISEDRRDYRKQLHERAKETINRLRSASGIVWEK